MPTAPQSGHARALLAHTRSERWLFEHVKAGDEVAFAEVHRRCHGSVYAFCHSQLLDHSLAKEADDETFVRVLNADAPNAANLRQWLFDVASNVCAEARCLRARGQLGVEQPQLEAAIDHESEESGRRMRERNLVLALRKMKRPQRSVLVLHELHELSSAEIAQALETTRHNVERLVRTAQDAFARIYAGVCHLPAECAHVFPLIYKQGEIGLEEDEHARLERHLAECPNCREETQWADKRATFVSALPLLAALGTRIGPGQVAQLLPALDPVFNANPYAGVPEVQHGWVKAASTATLGVALVLPSAALVMGLLGTGVEDVATVAPFADEGLESELATQTLDETKAASEAASKAADPPESAPAARAAPTSEYEDVERPFAASAAAPRYRAPAVSSGESAPRRRTAEPSRPPDDDDAEPPPDDDRDDEEESDRNGSRKPKPPRSKGSSESEESD